MTIIPRMAKMLMEGVYPISERIQEIAQSRAGSFRQNRYRPGFSRERWAPGDVVRVDADDPGDAGTGGDYSGQPVPAVRFFDRPTVRLRVGDGGLSR